VPPVPPLPPKVGEEQLRKALEQSMAGFEKAMEKFGKDNPEAREQMQKAMEAYRKAMEDGLKKGAWAVPGVPGLPLKELPRFDGEFRFEGFPREGAVFAGRPRLGVSVAPVPEALADQLELKGQGVLVTGVVAGTPAEKAGLKKNDVVLTFAGKTVMGPEAFAELVAAAKAEKVDLVVLRKGKKVELDGVTLADPKKDEPRRTEERKPTKPGAEKGPADKLSSFDTTTISVKDGVVRITSERDGTTYDITGEVEGGKIVPTSIVVKAGGETIKAGSVEKLPKEHQAAVKELLGSIGVAK
jgi:membrane-associated protease RseP (regulator of RpoE activity)